MSATWRKVIVSGSSPNFSAVQVDNLTNGQVVIGGGTAGNLSTTAINGSGNILATTAASGVSISGSFSGSFSGNGANVTGVVSASYATTASYAASSGPAAFSLTQGSGITNFTYNGSAAQTVAVSGASALSSNTVTKWTGNAFANSDITDDGTTVSIGSNKFQVTVASGNTTIAGNLTVNGTTTFINTQNVYIKDQFIQLASGSTSLVDAGFIGAYNASGSGSSFFISSTPGGYGRFAVAYDQVETVTSMTPNEYMVTVKLSPGAPAGNPTWGGANFGYGNMYINSSSSDIYIYA